MLDEGAIRRKFEAKAVFINERPSTSVPGWNHNPGATGQDLIDLYDASSRRCQFSGLMANVHAGGGHPPYWALSIDHIEPVHGQQLERLYDTRNLQIMISVFNSVKSNDTDEQLQEWYTDCPPFFKSKIKFTFVKLSLLNNSFFSTSILISVTWYLTLHFY